jgi:putative addiction module CopG family antidote
MESDITRLNLSLPEAMLQKIMGVVGEGSYATPSEFIRDVLRHEFQRREQSNQRDQLMEHLRSIIDQGLDSGTPVEITDFASWESTRLERLEKRAAKK